MSELIREELTQLQEKMEQLEASIHEMLFPKDKNLSRDAFVEVRAGTGGLEASLILLRSRQDVFQAL